MSQRVEAVLGTSGLRGPAVASLEGASGLFVLTDEQLLFHDGHGTRRVTLRDLARIHSDAEGTLRVETPAGVAMSASLIGFDGDEVQQFFGQVRDVTARVKSLTPPPPVTQVRTTESSRATRPPAPRATETAARGQGGRQDPDEGVTVTAVRRSEAEAQQFSGPPPKITVNRRGQREDLAAETTGMRENSLGLSGTSEAALDRDLPLPGSVEIRAVRKPGPQQARPSLTAPTADLSGQYASQTDISPMPQHVSLEGDETAEREPMDYDPAELQAMAMAGGTGAVAYAAQGHESHEPQQAEYHAVGQTPAQQPQAQHAAPAPQPVRYSAADLRQQAGKVRGVPGRLRMLGMVLLIGAVITAILMFLNAQRLFALWVLIAGVIGGLALLSVAEIAQLQAIKAALDTQDAGGSSLHEQEQMGEVPAHEQYEDDQPSYDDEPHAAYDETGRQG